MLSRFWENMAHPSPIRTNTAKQARSSTKGRLWAQRDQSPNPQPRKNLWLTVSGENSSTLIVLLLSVGTVITENVCCNCSDRTALSEKKTVLKPKSPEKSRPDEKDVEKSPAKKTDGQPLLQPPTLMKYIWGRLFDIRVAEYQLCVMCDYKMVAILRKTKGSVQDVTQF